MHIDGILGDEFINFTPNINELTLGGVPIHSESPMEDKFDVRSVQFIRDDNYNPNTIYVHKLKFSALSLDKNTINKGQPADERGQTSLPKVIVLNMSSRQLLNNKRHGNNMKLKALFVERGQTSASASQTSASASQTSAPVSQIPEEEIDRRFMEIWRELNRKTNKIKIIMQYFYK